EPGDSQGGRSAPSPRPASSPTSGRSSSLASPGSAFRLFLLGFRGFSLTWVGFGSGVLNLGPALPEGHPCRFRPAFLAKAPRLPGLAGRAAVLGVVRIVGGALRH